MDKTDNVFNDKYNHFLTFLGIRSIKGGSYKDKPLILVSVFCFGASTMGQRLLWITAESECAAKNDQDNIGERWLQPIASIEGIF